MRRRVVAALSMLVAVVLVSGTLAVYIEYRSVWDSITRIALTDLGKRPPKYTSALNILVFGYDLRKELTRHQQVAWHVGHVKENSSDTIMLVHISPGRRRVTVMSIPRDLMVPVYQCDAGRAPDGTSYPGQAAAPGVVEQINSIYALGGPSCLVKAVEQQTGIRIDHFIALGLAGFVRAINDLGGVYVCMPVAVNDSVSGLRLSRGWQTIDGATALKFWRTRENLGTGSDLQRIQRDQFFMASLLRGITHSGLLGDPARMLSVAGDLARSMTTDTGLSQADMVRIAASLQGVAGGHVQFITAPNGQDPADINKVILTQPQANLVFTAIAHDRKLPGGLKSAGGGAPPRAPASPATPASPTSPTPTSPKPPVSGLSGAYGGITGSARMCSSSGKAAFTGSGTP
jgi:LCP family protein required for cell wall assembly